MDLSISFLPILYYDEESTHPVFPLSNLEHPELLSAGAQHDEALHFIVDLIRVCRRAATFNLMTKL